VPTDPPFLGTHPGSGKSVHVKNGKPKNPSARERLQISKLKLTQLELMGEDVDVNAFKLEMAKVVPIDIIPAITDATVERTTAGASTLSVPVLDKDRLLLRSGAISRQVDVKIDGLWWRLTQFKKQADTITLIFEDREIAILRHYKNPIKASAATARDQITRAQFIRRLIREPVEYKHNPIPYVIPDLTKVEPVGLSTNDQAVTVSSDHQRSLGLSPSAAVTVKGRQATPTQIKNANTILLVGASMVLPRPVLVMAIMTAIQESSIQNLPMGKPGDFNHISALPDGNPVGVFQQIPKWWRSKGGASRNVAKDATAFFHNASDAYSKHPKDALWMNVLRAQDEPVTQSIGRAYQRWQQEADKMVTAFGVSSTTQAGANRQYEFQTGDTVSGNYEFYRGVPPQQGQNIWLPEDSWTCITRLAQEVNWRAFFVSGTFYYLDDARLFSSKPRMRVTEGKDGVDYIDGDYDERKKNSTLTVNCRIGRWSVPPGAVVELYNMGPMDGRWLVTDVSRSLFNDSGIVTIQKPQPQLPEPVSDSGSQALTDRISRGKGSYSQNQNTQALFGGKIPKADIGTRKGIVEAAQLALAAEQRGDHYHYKEIRPMPNSLFTPAGHKNGLDCSGFATLCYKEGGWPDPNGVHYNGSGNTASLAARGTWTGAPLPGDLAMYGGTRSYPAHVAVYIGNGMEIELGNDRDGVVQNRVNHYRTDLLGYVTFGGPPG
jgi:cell wall-associated NlpC family hydrolase